jgi:prepilin-type N-terminal cleavage/methylation domain-containing protein
MLLKRKNNKNQGFTIIEVMIVLAIAALILLIVLLAVPALQKTSRNTQRRNDVSAIGSALANLVNDNNGTLPAGIQLDSDATLIDICGAAGAANAAPAAADATGCTPLQTAKLGYYSPSNIWLNTTGATSSNNVSPTTVSKLGTAQSGSIITTDTVLIVNNETCSGSSAAYTERDIAIFYAVESGSGNGSVECAEG